MENTRRSSWVVVDVFAWKRIVHLASCVVKRSWIILVWISRWHQTRCTFGVSVIVWKNKFGIDRIAKNEFGVQRWSSRVYFPLDFNLYSCFFLRSDSDVNLFVEVQIETDLGNLVEAASQALRESRKFGCVRNFRSSIRCLHVCSGLFCEFRFGNPKHISDCSIIAELILADRRIYDLAVTIKFWLKINRCSDRSGFTCSVFVWLLIFYCQTLEEPLLPPIAELVRPSPDDGHLIFDFTRKIQSNNQQRFAELLLGFFQFYAEFDFSNFLISPLHGRAYNKVELESSKSPELQSMSSLSISSSFPVVRVQDPLNVTRLVSPSVNKRDLETLSKRFKRTAYVITDELYKNGETTELFIKLFNRKVDDDMRNYRTLWARFNNRKN